MERIAARSRHELLDLLSSIDIYVAPRGDKEDKRTKEQTERWSICRFLATYANTSFLRYPLSISKRERPDYLLIAKGRRVGIEVTEAVSQEFARLDAMRQRTGELIAVDTSLFRPGTPSRTSAELRDILEQHLSGPGWAGDGVERDWASVMTSVISTKAESARKPGYDHFDENWLLIYDNWSLPQLNEEKGLKLLLQQLAEGWQTTIFRNIFIEHNDNFLHIAAPTYGVRQIVDVRNGHPL